MHIRGSFVHLSLKFLKLSMIYLSDEQNCCLKNVRRLLTQHQPEHSLTEHCLLKLQQSIKRATNESWWTGSEIASLLGIVRIMWLPFALTA